MAKPIVLVGMMGAGKSTIGKRLAVRLGVPFVDADSEIVSAAGMPISEIFERYGEGYFRDGERRVLGRLLDGRVSVIATGGGAFMDPTTRHLILQHSVAVWLRASIDTLVTRVERRNHRPLLQGRDARTVLADLAATRDAVYALAPIQVRSDDAPHEVAVESIIKALQP